MVYLYVYDCRRARETNARRVAFTKELYGYVYSWKTRAGKREKKKPGLLDQCPGAKAIANSAIMVPAECKGMFDRLFREYSDILSTVLFDVRSFETL